MFIILLEQPHIYTRVPMLLYFPGDTVFKAKAQRADVEDAEVVVESHDTEVERPLDLEEAEEVEEEKGEEFEGEGETATDNKVLYEWIFSAPIKQMLLSAQ